MELTAEQVDSVAETREVVQMLLSYTEENDVAVLDAENLQILDVQLDALHQALSVVVAQKQQARRGDGDD